MPVQNTSLSSGRRKKNTAKAAHTTWTQVGVVCAEIVRSVAELELQQSSGTLSDRQSLGAVPAFRGRGRMCTHPRPIDRTQAHFSPRIRERGGVRPARILSGKFEWTNSDFANSAPYNRVYLSMCIIGKGD